MAKLLNALSPVAAVVNGIKKTNNKLNNLVNNRPQYNINKEYTDNQDLSRNQAYGRDRAVTNAEQGIDQSTDAAFEAAKESTNSTPALLAALTGMNANAGANKVDLVAQEQQARARGMNNMLQANEALAEEKDKAWNTNVNEPYQDQVKKYREKQKFARDAAMKGLDLAGSLAVKGLSGGIA